MNNRLYYKIENITSTKTLYSNELFTKFWVSENSKIKLLSNYTGKPIKNTFFNYYVDTEDIDIILVGIPYSDGSLIQSKVDLFPDFLRTFSLKYPVYQHITSNKSSGIFDIENNKKLFDNLAFNDIGNLSLLNKVELEIDELIKWLYNKKVKNITIGGDHSITYHCINSLVNKYKKPIIPIIFDAHHDCKSTLYEEGNLNHANFVSKLLELDGVKKIIQIGVRGIRPISHLNKNDKIIPLNIDDNNIEGIIERILNKFPDALGYISVDLDVLSPIEFRAVDFPIPCEPVAKKVIKNICKIFSSKLIILSADIVEGLTNGEMYQYTIPLQILCYLMDGFKSQLNI